MKRYSIRNSIGQKTPNISKQRNIRDPAYKAQCIQKLSSYLGDIDPKSLELPSVKEFQSIFKYFYSQLEPNLELIDNKFDDEAISFLRMMKYPYMTEVTKSQLMSISPHSWPALLSMLTWLCDICALNKPNEIREESVESLFHEYVCESFKEYMLSGVENKEKEINYLKRVEGLAKKKEEEIEKLKLELKQKKEKIVLAENKPLGEISEDLMNYKNCKSKDIPQIKEHLKMKKEELEQRNNANLIKAKELDMKSKEKESEISALNSELEFLKEEVRKIDVINENYKTKIENQGMSIEEIISFRRKMIVCSEKIEQIKLINKEIKSKNIEKENEYKNQLEKLEELLNDYKNKKSVLTKSFFEAESNQDSENKNNSLVEDLLDINEVNIFEKDLSLTITCLNDQLKTLNTKLQLIGLENQSYHNKLQTYNKEILDHENTLESISKEIIEMSSTYIKMKENLESKRKRNEKEVDNLKKEIYKLNLEGKDDLMITEKEYNLLLSKYDVHMLNLISKKEKVMKVVKEIEDGVINRYSIINEVLKSIQSDK